MPKILGAGGNLGTVKPTISTTTSSAFDSYIVCIYRIYIHNESITTLAPRDACVTRLAVGDPAIFSVYTIMKIDISPCGSRAPKKTTLEGGRDKVCCTSSITLSTL
jgi:hypothetical protein